VIPASCGGIPIVTMSPMLIALTPPDEKLPKYAERSQMIKMRSRVSSSDIYIFLRKLQIFSIISLDSSYSRKSAVINARLDEIFTHFFEIQRIFFP
jgi:hypothetical protein